MGNDLGPTSAAAINALPKENAGVATGVLWTIQVIGGAIGVAISGVLFQSDEQFKMLQALKQASLILSQKQQHFLSILLSNPQDLPKSAMYFVPTEQTTILKDYISAFLYGYQHSMLLLFVVCLLGCGISLWGRRRAPSKAEVDILRIRH